MEQIYNNLRSSGKDDSILIADDDPVNRKILGKLFSTYYSIIEAADGHNGMEQILGKKNQICAILVDVMMPGMNGIEVVRRMKGK